MHGGTGSGRPGAGASPVTGTPGSGTAATAPTAPTAPTAATAPTAPTEPIAPTAPSGPGGSPPEEAADAGARLSALDRLVAHEEIRQLVARYALAVDSRDLDELVSLFVDDVRVGAERGRDALRRSFEASLRRIGVSILHVGTQVIDVADAEHATGSVYCRGEIQDDRRWIHQAILYRDTYACRDGRWLFVRRRHLLFYGAEVGVNPLGLAPAEWPAHHDGWGTVPESWESWRRFWREGG